MNKSQKPSKLNYLDAITSLRKGAAKNESEVIQNMDIAALVRVPKMEEANHLRYAACWLANSLNQSDQ